MPYERCPYCERAFTGVRDFPKIKIKKVELKDMGDIEQYLKNKSWMSSIIPPKIGDIEKRFQKLQGLEGETVNPGALSDFQGPDEVGVNYMDSIIGEELKLYFSYLATGTRGLKRMFESKFELGKITYEPVFHSK